MTQASLGLLSGISQQHLSYLEQGKGGVELATLQKLLDALGHELAFVPRPMTPAAALARRSRQWDDFAAWEKSREPARASLAQAGELADFFRSRHRTAATQAGLRVYADHVRAWRDRLARVKVP